jgi:Tfp pilus assembly protein PilX
MSQKYAWSWHDAKPVQVNISPQDPAEIIAHHETKQALERAHAAAAQLVADAHANPEIVNTCRAAAWARAGHAVRIKATTAGDGSGWDFDAGSIPEGWPAEIVDPVEHVKAQLAERGIRWDIPS